MVADKQIWWEGPNAVPVGIFFALLFSLRAYSIYVTTKNARRRSARVRRIEVIVATVLWTFILLAVTVLLLAAGFRG